MVWKINKIRSKKRRKKIEILDDRNPIYGKYIYEGKIIHGNRAFLEIRQSRVHGIGYVFVAWLHNVYLRPGVCQDIKEKGSKIEFRRTKASFTSEKDRTVSKSISGRRLGLFPIDASMPEDIRNHGFSWLRMWDRQRGHYPCQGVGMDEEGLN